MFVVLVAELLGRLYVCAVAPGDGGGCHLQTLGA